MKAKQGFWILLVLLAFSLFSCRKIDLQEKETASRKSMEEIVVDPHFNWEMTRTIEVALEGSASGVVKIMPAEGDYYFHKGFLTGGIPYKTQISVPTSAEKIQLVFQGQTYTVLLTGDRLTFTFGL